MEKRQKSLRLESFSHYWLIVAALTSWFLKYRKTFPNVTSVVISITWLYKRQKSSGSNKLTTDTFRSSCQTSSGLQQNRVLCISVGVIHHFVRSRFLLMIRFLLLVKLIKHTCRPNVTFSAWFGASEGAPAAVLSVLHSNYLHVSSNQTGLIF